MINAIITTAGAALIAAKHAASEILSIDQFVCADIDGLDTETTPPSATVMPDAGDIVNQSAITATGLIDTKTVAYSKVLDATMGDWHINWMGIYSSADDVLVAVAYVPRHLKFATDGFRAGNTLYKNFALEINNVSDLTGIVIDAASWQFDFDTVFVKHTDYNDWAYMIDNAPVGFELSSSYYDAAPSDKWLEYSGSKITDDEAYADPLAVYVPELVAWLETEQTAGRITIKTEAEWQAGEHGFFANIDADCYRLPEKRGVFPRIADHGRGLDPDAATRTGGDTVGSGQSSANFDHNHNTGIASIHSDIGVYGSTTDGMPGLSTDRVTMSTSAGDLQHITSSEGNNEARPVNASIGLYLKAKP